MIRVEIVLTRKLWRELRESSPWELANEIGEALARVPDAVPAAFAKLHYDRGYAEGLNEGMSQGVEEGKQFKNANDLGMATKNGSVQEGKGSTRRRRLPR